MVKTGKKDSLRQIWPLLFPMGSYLLLSLVFDVVIISVFTFVHFSLSHPLPQIEEWLIEHSWEVVILGKVLALYCSFKAVSSRPDWPQKWWKLIFLRKWPSLNMIAGCFAGILALLLFSGVLFKHHFHPFRLEANLGMLIFFSIDIFWFRLLMRISERKYSINQGSLVLLAVIMGGINFLKYPYLQSLNFLVLVHFVFVLNFKNDSDVLAYLLLFFVPLHALFVGDFAFGRESALFELRNAHIMAVAIAFLLGFYWKRSNIWPRHIDDFPSNSDNSI